MVSLSCRPAGPAEPDFNLANTRGMVWSKIEKRIGPKECGHAG